MQHKAHRAGRACTWLVCAQRQGSKCRSSLLASTAIDSGCQLTLCLTALAARAALPPFRGVQRCMTDVQ